MQLDQNKLMAIVDQLFVPNILREYGDIGVSALKELLENLRKIYKIIAPELIMGELIVFKAFQELDLSHLGSSPVVVSQIEFLLHSLSPEFRSCNNVIQIGQNGEVILWRNVSANTELLAQNSITYVYRSRTDIFVIKDAECPVINPSPVHASVFAVPTFSDLSTALEDYKHRSVRTSTCQIFAQSWYGGENSDRLFFRNKPEEVMRQSLTQYLRTVLRNAEVRPEQNVDETHPVDIKVTWMFTNKIALIEIKWLGKAITDNERFTEYFDQRAREGAEQLANYLDSNRIHAPIHETIGYLVVIDGRRRGLNPRSTSVNNENGMWYHDKEITYTPEYHTTRNDFASPIRMFAEPKCKAD